MTDEEIDACRNSVNHPHYCRACSDHARCAELYRAEYLRERGLEPPEDLPTVTSEWVRVRGDRAEYEVRDEGT